MRKVWGMLIRKTHDTQRFTNRADHDGQEARAKLRTAMRLRQQAIADVEQHGGMLGVVKGELVWVLVDRQRGGATTRFVRLTGGFSEVIEECAQPLIVMLSPAGFLAAVALATGGLDWRVLVGWSELQVSVLARVLAGCLWREGA